MKLIDPGRLLKVDEAAVYLLGCEIERITPDGKKLRGRIVETESYHQEDPASHTFRGESNRTKAMFGPAGHAYIYFTYGMHWCFNVTAGPIGYGAGVLIRAIEPLEGLEVMQNNRGNASPAQLTNGPAKLAQALAISKELYGHNLRTPPLKIFQPEKRDFKITKTTRIGISQAVDEVARFYITDNPWVSRK